MASVSGSAATNSTFERSAKSATASPTFDRKVPASSATFSFDTSSVARRIASSGLPASSRETTSIRRPSTPPAAFASSTASCHPMRYGMVNCGMVE